MCTGINTVKVIKIYIQACLKRSLKGPKKTWSLKTDSLLIQLNYSDKIAFWEDGLLTRGL